MYFQSFKYVNIIIFTVCDIMIFRQTIDLVKKRFMVLIQFFGIRVFPFISLSSSTSVRFEKGVISLINFLQYQDMSVFLRSLYVFLQRLLHYLSTHQLHLSQQIASSSLATGFLQIKQGNRTIILSIVQFLNYLQFGTECANRDLLQQQQ